MKNKEYISFIKMIEHIDKAREYTKYYMKKIVNKEN